MLRKIVSGGQTGADRAALDLAIEWNIAHGGWVPRGRKAEDGPLPEKYHLKEMDSVDYADRTERNVVDSDGTLIFSHGPLTGGSALTQKIALKHGQQWLHVDLLKTRSLMAAQSIHDWIFEHDIEVLNVAGPRESQDPRIYRATYDILEAVLHLFTIRSHMDPSTRPRRPLPATMDEAVEQFLSQLPLKEKSAIARMEQKDLRVLYPTLGRRMEKAFGLREGNDQLLADCSSISGKPKLKTEEAVQMMMEALWRKLRGSHGLRVVR